MLQTHIFLQVRCDVQSFPMSVASDRQRVTCRCSGLSEFGWREFRNERFGLLMRYPSDVFVSRRSSASGDGDLFETSNAAARLLVGAIANTDHFTPRSYQSFIARKSYPGLRVDYAPIGQSWAGVRYNRPDDDL